MSWFLTIPQITLPTITIPQIQIPNIFASEKNDMQRGNQFGLKPGDRVLLSEDVHSICNSQWNPKSNTFKATVVGYDQYGYPIVFLDNPHARCGYAAHDIDRTGGKLDVTAFNKVATSGMMNEKGRCVAIYADAAFRRLDANDNPIRKQVPVCGFGLTPGDLITVTEEYGKPCDGRWGTGRQTKATVIGCQENGLPLVMLEDNPANAQLGWPLSNILEENGLPRVESTVAKSLRARLRADPKFRERRCFYLQSKEAFQIPMEDKNMDVQKNFGLDYGDRVSLSYDDDGIEYEFNDSHSITNGTVIGFRKDDGTPIVVFDEENEESGWGLNECLTQTKNGKIVGKANFSFDPVLLQSVCDKVSGNFAFYIGNPEVFKKIAKKKGKEKKMAKNTETDVEVAASESGNGNKVMTRLKKSAAKVPYRVARMQAVTNGKNAILNAAKDRLDPNTFAMLEGFLGSDVGQGALLGLIGLLGPMIPKVGEDPRVQALCEEFLDEGVAKGSNQAIDLAMAVLAPALMSAVASLPPVAEAVEAKAAAKQKRRIASDTPAETETDTEVEEEEEAEEETASSRKGLRSV